MGLVGAQARINEEQARINEAQAITIKQLEERTNELGTTKLHLKGIVSDNTPVTCSFRIRFRSAAIR
jgi:hypothetical protein